MIEFILEWATKEKFYSRYLLLIFLIIILLSNGDNIKLMINELENTELIGFIFKESFISVFVWMILIVILLEIYWTLRGEKNINSQLIALKTEVSKINTLHEVDGHQLVKKFFEADSKMQDKVFKLLNILILTSLEAIFLLIKNNFKSAHVYILCTMLLLVILFVLFSIIFFNSLRNINSINKKINEWKKSVNRSVEKINVSDRTLIDILNDQLDKKDKQIETMQTLLNQQQELTLETNRQIQHLQLEETKKSEKGFFNCWFRS